MLYQLSSFNSPESLYDQCLHFLVDNWRECLIEKNALSDNVESKKNLVLPNQICEGFFELHLRKNKVLTSDFLNVFKNPIFTKLKKINIRKDYYFTICIQDFFPVLHQDLRELHLHNESSEISKILDYLKKNGNNIKILSCNKTFFSSAFKIRKQENTSHAPIIIVEKRRFAFEDWPYVLNTPNLERLSLMDFNQTPPPFFFKLIIPLKKLTHLDITNCYTTIDYSFLSELPVLKSLTLHNIFVTEEGFKIIKKLPELEHLDLSFSTKMGLYQKPKCIYFLLKGLPKLTSLDISKTDLDIDIGEALKIRKNELQYLGLYKSFNNACRENGLYAKRISGDANIKQLFHAGYAHFEREILMNRLLNDFIADFDSFIEYDLILDFALKILDRHPKLAGDCQNLFKRYITSRIPLTLKAKNHVICTTMNMAIIENEEIDIELFSKWTADELFRNVKVVTSFISCLIEKKMEKQWVQVILYRILNIISESQKELFAIHGVIKTLATAIANIKEPYYFEWDFTWRCIKNNLSNSKAFLENITPGLFIKEMDYLTEHSSESKEVMERELVVYFSLAQFECLANEYLLQESFISKLLELLVRDFPQSPFRPNNGPRVNYYAGCILLKLLSYESSQTAIDKPKREEILKKILINLEKWSLDLIPYCYIEEELLELILNLSGIEHIPECRYWAVWGIFHCRHDLRQDYSWSERDGISLLKSIVEIKSVPCNVKEISEKLLKRWSSDS